MNKSEPRTPDLDRKLVKSIVVKLTGQDRATETSLIKASFEEIYDQLSSDEVKLIKQLLAIDPKYLGFLGPFVVMEEPHNLVAIEGQQYKINGREVVIPTQYLPNQVWERFQEMQAAIKKELGRRLMIESGYRSPACQAITFLKYLVMNNYDILKTAKGVALPGYSQHGSGTHTAMDVINQDGIPTDEQPEEFEHTKEYKWLVENAGQFSFYLTYPKGNSWGVKFEPWHWQYRQPAS